MKRTLLFLLFSAPLLLWAQDLTGVWQGHFRSTDGGERSALSDLFSRYKIEVQIAQRDKKFSAVTYSYLSNLFYGKAAAVGTVNPKTGKVILQEGKLLDVRNGLGGGACPMMYFLQYTKSGNDEFLEGKYVSMPENDSSSDCAGRGIVFLHKVANSDFPVEPFLIEREKELKKEGLAKEKPAEKPAPAAPTTSAKRPPAIASAKPHAHHPDSARLLATNKPATHHPLTHHPAAHPRPSVTQPASPPPMARVTMPKPMELRPKSDSSTGLSHSFATIAPPVLRDRQNQLLRSLVVNTREVVLNIYDDGVIDGDSVSVYLDNRMIIHNAMLTDRPLVVHVHLDADNDYHELVMVADNEGTIPPNTSLMIVRAGDKEYKVNISTSLQKNATITFKYEKPN